jgi:aryl-alcohol dehydrogenase-like predicted oxidoreductase
VVAYGALSRGLLSGALPELTAGDFRAHTPRFVGENLAHNLTRVELLKSLAAQQGCTAAQLAIAWLLAQGQDIVPLIGTSKRVRLAENLGALAISLDAAIVEALEVAFASGTIAGERYAAQQLQAVPH